MLRDRLKVPDTLEEALPDLVLPYFGGKGEVDVQAFLTAVRGSAHVTRWTACGLRLNFLSNPLCH